MNGLLACVLAAALPQDAKPAVKEAVEGFFDACRKKDAQAASRFWSSESPGYEAFGKRAVDSFELPPEDVPSAVEVRKLFVQDETAYAYVGFKGRWPDEQRYDDEPLTIWHVVLRRIMGEWKWWAQEPAADDFARLLATSDAPIRAELLKECDFLVTTRLVHALRSGADDAGLAGRLPDALAWVGAADEVAERLGKPILKAYCRYTRGSIYLGAGQPKESLAPLEESRKGAEEAKDRLLVGEASLYMGLALVAEYRPDRARPELERALAVAEETSDVATRVMAECGLGSVHRLEGRYAEAQDLQEKSLRRARAVGGRAGAALVVLALSELGQTRLEAGDLGGALGPLLEALETAREFQYVQFQGKVLLVLGGVYLSAGDPAKALEHLGGALECWEGLNNDRMRGRTLTAVGSARMLLRDFDGGAEALQAARELLAKAGDAMGIAEAACNQALVRLLNGEAEEAARGMREAIELLPPQGHEFLLATIRIGLAAALLEQRAWPEALALLEEQVRAAEKMGPNLRLWSRAGLGRAYAGRAGPGDLERALDCFGTAMALLEDARRDLAEQTVQQTFFSQFAQVHVFRAETLLRLDRAAEAFAMSEEAKARTLVDLLEQPGLRLSTGMSEEERREEEALEGRASALVRRLELARSTDDRLEVESHLRQVRGAAEDFRRRVFLAHPELRVRRGRFAPATLEEINRSLFAEEPDLAVVSYLTGPEGVLVFVLRKGTDAASVAVWNIPLKFGDLLEGVTDFWARCATPDGDYVDGARSLYDVLLKPVEPELAGASRLLIVPDRMLHFLPFQALRDAEGRHLIEKWGVSFAPSVTALLKMREIRDARARAAYDDRLPLLAVGAPEMPPGFGDLAHAAREVERVSELFKVPALTGGEALESRVKERLPRARRIHVASHGKVNEAAPLRSFVVLGRDDRDDGFLSAQELAELRLQADLIVLSACETGLGQWRGGEGVVGLAWSAAAAGIPASLLSQWQVEDESTGKLMAAFYGALVEPGCRSKADALRSAQRSLLQDERRRHPYYWAPFVLIGDARE